MLFQLSISPISEKQQKATQMGLDCTEPSNLLLLDKDKKDSINLRESTFNFKPHEFIHTHTHTHMHICKIDLQHYISFRCTT